MLFEHLRSKLISRLFGRKASSAPTGGQEIIVDPEWLKQTAYDTGHYLALAIQSGTAEAAVRDIATDLGVHEEISLPGGATVPSKEAITRVISALSPIERRTVWVTLRSVEDFVDLDFELAEDVYALAGRLQMLIEAEAHQYSQVYYAARQLIARPGEEALGPEDLDAVAPVAEQTIDHSMARLFMRLGPPPEPAESDFTPSGRGGGGGALQ